MNHMNNATNSKTLHIHVEGNPPRTLEVYSGGAYLGKLENHKLIMAKGKEDYELFLKALFSMYHI